MTPTQALSVASKWVRASEPPFSEFKGAFLHGSVCYLSRSEHLGEYSDIDVVLVCDDDDCTTASGKQTAGEAVLDVSAVSKTRLDSPETVLADHVFAGPVAAGLIVWEDGSWLTQLHEVVARRFRETEWVRARYRSAAWKAQQVLRNAVRRADPVGEALTTLFGVGILTHILLVAACQNPTVRRRYEAAYSLLASQDRLDLHEALLSLLVSATLSRESVAAQRSRMIEAYDLAVRVTDAPPRFANHVNRLSRRAAVEGTQAAIDSGLHRESIFWIANCYARSLLILKGAVPPHLSEGFEALLADLGIATRDQRRRRAEEARAQLPEILRVAEELV